MIDRDSTLYQLDNAVAEFHYAVLKTMDPNSWKSPKQFMVYTHSSLADIRREFENRYGKFNYPSMVIVRDGTVKFQADNNINTDTGMILQDNMQYDVRPITVGYTCVIIDSRKKYIDEYYELFMMEVKKYSPRIDVLVEVGKQDDKPVVVHNLTSISYEAYRLSVESVPSYDEKTSGNGQIYTLKIPFDVDSQLIGNYQESKLIRNLIVNYVSMNNNFKTEVDNIPTTPLMDERNK